MVAVVLDLAATAAAVRGGGWTVAFFAMTPTVAMGGGCGSILARVWATADRGRRSALATLGLGPTAPRQEDRFPADQRTRALVVGQTAREFQDPRLRRRRRSRHYRRRRGYRRSHVRLRRQRVRRQDYNDVGG